MKNLIFLIPRINCIYKLYTRENCAPLCDCMREVLHYLVKVYFQNVEVLCWYMKWKLPAPNDIVFLNWIRIKNLIVYLSHTWMLAYHSWFPCDFICTFYCTVQFLGWKKDPSIKSTWWLTQLSTFWKKKLGKNFKRWCFYFP